MPKPLAWIAAMIVVTFLCLPARAWNAFGHEEVAYIAWQQMTPGQRIACTAILKGHPHYADELAAGLADDDKDRDLHVFMKAATWPDLVRMPKFPDERGEHKATWHYYDVPVTPDGKAVPMPKLEQTTAEPTNAVQALKFELGILNDKKAEPAARAKALCWVLHIVGDLHQPLHCVSLYDADFPTGDRGGNLIKIKDSNGRSNLHGLWDGILGQKGTLNDVALAGDFATKENAAAVADRAKDLDAGHWVTEGRDLAAKTAYEGVELNPAGELLANVDRVNVTTDRDYLRRARDTARIQVVLGGERLAVILK